MHAHIVGYGRRGAVCCAYATNREDTVTEAESMLSRFDVLGVEVRMHKDGLTHVSVHNRGGSIDTVGDVNQPTDISINLK